MSNSSRNVTAWDLAAMRVSRLQASDGMQALSRPSSLKSTYGVRPLPINLGSMDDLGLPPSLAPENASVPSHGMPPRSRRDPLDLFDTSFVLKQDTLPPLSHHWEGLSDATIRLRRQQRVVDKSIERSSPYVPAFDSGPMRARIPVMQREFERANAAYQRSLFSTRSQSPSKDVSLNHAQDPDERVCQALPHRILWTDKNELAWREDRYGWLFSPKREECIPDSLLLEALHYYAAQFFHTNDVLSPALATATPSDSPAVVCEQIRDQHADDMPDMEPGSELWEYWARHSLGCGRTMLGRLDGSALVALACLVQAYTQELLPKHVPSSPKEELDDTWLNECSYKRQKRQERRAQVREFFHARACT